MSINVTENFSRVRATHLVLPLVLLVATVALLGFANALSVPEYALVQEDVFMAVNHGLGQFGVFENNVTQLGNGLILMSFLTLLVIFNPRVWSALLLALLVSVVFSVIMKASLGVPRPPRIYDNSLFFIIERRMGFNSTPSGHSITAFCILSVVLFAFMPRKATLKAAWTCFVLALGLVIVSSRIAVGAHYPIDVLGGSIIGYISGICGVLLDRQWPVLSNWFANRKSYPFFMLVFVVGMGFIVGHILDKNLLIYYLALISVTISLVTIVIVYVKR